MKTIRYLLLATAFSFMAAHASYAIPDDGAKKTIAKKVHSNAAIGGPATKKGAGISGTDVKTKSSPTPHP